MSSLFKNPNWIADTFCYNTINRPSSWPVIVICILLLLISVILASNRKRFSLIIRSFYLQRNFSLLTREGRLFEERIIFVVLLFDMMTFALGLLMLGEHYNPELIRKVTSPGAYGIILAALFALYFLKMSVNYLYAYLFDRIKERMSLILYKFIFVTNAAIALLPLLIFIQFTGTNSLFFVYIPIFCVFLLLYLYKLLKINPKKVNLFHFFIYFCTLEILPYLVLVVLYSMIW